MDIECIYRRPGMQHLSRITKSTTQRNERGKKSGERFASLCRSIKDSTVRVVGTDTSKYQNRYTLANPETRYNPVRGGKVQQRTNPGLIQWQRTLV